MPVFDIDPGGNPKAAGTMTFGVEGETPGLSVTTAGVLSLAGTPLVSSYAPLATTLYLGAATFLAMTGGPTVGTPGSAATRVNAWTLDAASAESVGVTFQVPAGWATAHVDLYWTNDGAGAGDVVWKADRYTIADGTALTAETEGGAVTATAPAQNVVKVTRALTGIAVSPSLVTRLEVVRVAADAADTLANDVALIGVLLTRVS